MQENEVMARAVKTFHGEEGFKNPDSAPFQVSRQRFADLKANGLVVEAESNVTETADSGAAAHAVSDEGGEPAGEPVGEQSAEPPAAKPARGQRNR
jgi:hypothetical protein